MGLKDILIIPSEIKCPLGDMETSMITKCNKKEAISVENFITLVHNGYFTKPGQIHEFLEKCEIEFVLTDQELRNPDLEARVSKLKIEQENNEYKRMVKNIDSLTQAAETPLRTEIKQVTSQITAVINFVLTVIGTFCFTYKALEYALPESNIPVQVLVSIVTSTVVALADLFFLARTI